ncbi:FtsW/RodA/SpoVE family cell cycle protein, partial [Faecalibacillus intestinalis]|nr:FtsW/RodA/SpoVE family cell cycle protein [Faecalibacillus intestinalis]
VNGANCWINLGPISIQPAEFIKLFMIVYWADRCTKVNDELHRPSMQDYVSGLILTAILLILIIIQPDVGGFSINFAIAALIIMASGYNSRWTILIFDGLLLIGMVALPSLAKVVATGHIKNYQVARFVAFVNPFGTQSGAGSQLVNSYYAISNGG